MCYVTVHCVANQKLHKNSRFLGNTKFLLNTSYESSTSPSQSWKPRKSLYLGKFCSWIISPWKQQAYKVVEFYTLYWIPPSLNSQSICALILEVLMSCISPWTLKNVPGICTRIIHRTDREGKKPSQSKQLYTISDSRSTKVRLNTFYLHL